MSSVSFAIKLDKWTHLKNDLHPIVLQVIFPKNNKSTKQNIRLGYKCSVKDWDANKEQFKMSFPDFDIFNPELEEQLTLAWKTYHKEFKKGKFNFVKFSNLFKLKKKGSSVVSFIDALVDDIINNKRKLTRKKKLSIGTARSFIYIKNAIRNYGSDINVTFEEVTEEWLEDFESNMLEGGCNEGGAAAYMRSFKSIYGYACDNKFVDGKYYPFKGRYSRDGYCFAHLDTKPKKRKDRITAREIKQIYYHDISDRKYKDKYREAIDLFVLSYLTFGANFEDMVRFTEDNICEEEGIEFLRFYRKKTINSSAKYTEIPLLPITKEILNRYRGKSGTKFIFSILNEDQEVETLEVKRYLENYLTSIRKRIRRVAKREGIDKYIIFYTPRYSTGKIAKRAGASMEMVADAYGHSSTRTTRKHYTGGSDAVELMDIMKLIEF